jgi:hypothetical protein
LTLKGYIVSVDEDEGALEPSSFQRPRRLARPRTPPFHGDNKSSNLFGDTNQFNCFSSWMPRIGDKVTIPELSNLVCGSINC